MVYPPSSSRSNVHYQPLAHDDPDFEQQEDRVAETYTDEVPPYEDGDADIDLEANEMSSLVPRMHPAPNMRSQAEGSSTTRGIFSNLGGSFLAVSSQQASGSQYLRVSPVESRVTTPLSSDGVFTNIPAKPTSSRDVNKEDEEMGPDEWIFMTPEQRKKLPPPKYSRIKRDRAPRYSETYNPPVLPVPRSKTSRRRPVRARINSHPSGHPSHFIITCVISTVFPLLGFLFCHLASKGHFRKRWKTHSAQLGSRAGFGMGLLHVGLMILYIPALASICSRSRQSNPSPLDTTSWIVHNIPLLLSLLFIALIFLPIGWPLFHLSLRSYLWIRAQERVLRERLLSTGVPDIAVNDGEGDTSDDGEAMERDEGRDGYMYIEGTDLRVKDLKRALARARDARLARSLRAAGF